MKPKYAKISFIPRDNEAEEAVYLKVEAAADGTYAEPRAAFDFGVRRIRSLSDLTWGATVVSGEWVARRKVPNTQSIWYVGTGGNDGDE